MEEAELETIKLEKKEKLQEEQRKFRNLESDRKYYAEEAISRIKKQKGTIEKLKKENETLKELISKLNDRKPDHSQTGSSFGNSEQRIADLKEAIQRQVEMQQQTQMHIRNFQNKIIEKKKNMGGYNAGAENENTLQKQIKILENRLDKANQKFNQAIAVNRQLRQVIDSLRRERVIFDNLYKKLEKELHEKRKEMANIIEKANTAYEERDKANSQIQNLKQQAKKEATDFEKELKELSSLMQKAKLASCLKPAQRKEEHFEMQETDKLFAKTSKNLRQIREKVNVSQIASIQKYREDFSKIQAATQIQDFNQLIRIFNENEQKNFKIFKYVNEQSNEIQELEAEVEQLKNELSQYEVPTDSSEATKEKQVDDLEMRLQNADKKYKDYESKYRDSMKQVKCFINHIENIFNTIECDKDLAKEIAGSKNVSQSNMMLFLGIIEQKVVKIVKAFKDIAYKNHEGINAENQSQIPANLNKKINQAFAFDDMEDDDEQYDKLLTHDDFRRKATEKITKEQNSKLKKRDVRAKKK